MSRRAKTIVVLAFEVCLLAGMCASFAYFARDSRDFIAQRQGVPMSVPAER